MSRWIDIVAICEATGSLPYDGGVLDQMPMHIMYIRQVLRAKHQYQDDEMEKEKAKK